MKQRDSFEPSYVPPQLAAAIKAAAKHGTLFCAAAFDIAASHAAPPALVGAALDADKIRITHCQLGLFGYGEKKKVVAPADTIAVDLRRAIESHLADGSLTCAAAWEIAESLSLSKIEVAAACEAMKIKIRCCQLGAF